jgi:hypothetical protein
MNSLFDTQAEQHRQRVFGAWADYERGRRRRPGKAERRKSLWDKGIRGASDDTRVALKNRKAEGRACFPGIAEHF